MPEFVGAPRNAVPYGKESPETMDARSGRMAEDPVRAQVMSSMNEVTTILSAIDAGDPRAAAELLPLVYDELRKLAAAQLAAEKSGQTLQATALVHEAYLRLVGSPDGEHWNHRGHFFAAAAEAIRRILVETVAIRNPYFLQSIAKDRIVLYAA